ncbi:MAG: Bsp6I family type II restriction endonuclease [Coprobacter sp.]|nr:Bsp6I family type II restriction endonuclease [Coprobacter sp.]
MITTTKLLNLPEGQFQAKVDIYDNSDRKKLEDVYRSWRILCDQASALKARKINLPDALSECGFCYFFKYWRTNYGIAGATHSSFDAYDPGTNSRIQIKGCSVKSDLTSFGPDSVWDKLYFVDFYKEGKWDFTFDVYLIDNKDIYQTKVNKNETFIDQQRQKRRPRFSIIKEIIKPKGIKPQYTCNIKTGELKKHY